MVTYTFGTIDDIPKCGLSHGAIAGIVVGTVVRLFVLYGIFFCFWKKKRGLEKTNNVPHIQPTGMHGNSTKQQPMAQMPYGQQTPG